MTITCGAEIDQVKSFHRSFVTGVTAVTTLDGDRPCGLVVNAFASLSLDPPSVVACVQRSSTSHPALVARDVLAVSILAADQAEVCDRLASKAPDKFAGVSWTRGPYGSPILDGATAWLEGRITDRIESGTHTMFVAHVLAAHSTTRPPLLYTDGRTIDGSVLGTRRPDR